MLGIKSGKAPNPIFEIKSSRLPLTDGLASEDCFQTQLDDMNQSAIKLGAFIMKLESLIESNPVFKMGDQAALMQISLVKE